MPSTCRPAGTVVGYYGYYDDTHHGYLLGGPVAPEAIARAYAGRQICRGCIAGSFFGVFRRRLAANRGTFMQHRQPGAHASVAKALLSIASFVMAISLAETAIAKDTVLYSFRGAPDGEQPWGPLIADRHHNLFGTTNLGGTGSCSNGSGCGTVFELSPQGNGVWAESVLYSFQGGNDGQNPPAALLLDA